MPITLSSVTFEYRSLPLILHADGSAVITLRKGYSKEGEFIALTEETYAASKEEVSGILDVQGINGLTRRNDFSLALYQFCVSKGAEVGTIT